MRYALDNEGNRITVQDSGQQAFCPLCNSNVIGKKGEIKKKHWAHKKNEDCDSWYEPLTEWHIKWQIFFPEKNREVIIKQSDKQHRADIQINNGMVIEVQNSPIPINKIRAREDFYGRNNMIWILNGETLALKSHLKVGKLPYLHYFIIEFPSTLPNNPNYLTEEFYDHVLDNYLLFYHDNKMLTSNRIIFTSYEKIGELNELELTQLRYFIVTSYQSLYNHVDIELFRNKLKIYSYREMVNHKSIILIKKYWRSFIDEMAYPVFIDNLNGLEEDELYWYQKNTIINKEKFLKKYLN